nr:hypothetical protein [Tanacetum cinerariifolium]
EAIYPSLANIRKSYAHIAAKVAAKVRKEEMQSRKQCQKFYVGSKGASKAKGEDQFQQWKGNRRLRLGRLYRWTFRWLSVHSQATCYLDSNENRT